jgi:echinoderm microtubule-associated protein-like 6
MSSLLCPSFRLSIPLLPQGDWGKKATPQLLLSAVEFNGQLHTGAAGGQIYTWERSPTGGLISLGGPTLHEAAVASLWTDQQYLLSGGKDGVVKILDKRLLCAMEYRVPDPLSHADVNALGSVRNRSRVAVGTRGGSVVELTSDGYHKVLTAGHCLGQLRAFDAHSSREEAVTGGDDGTVRLLDLHAMTVMRSRQLDSFVRALVYSPTADLIAAGFGGRVDGSDSKRPGCIHLLNSQSLESEAVVDDADTARDAVVTLRYSPDGGQLAVGCQSGGVVLYDMAGNFACKRGVLAGHVTPVTCLDFTIDGQYLRALNEAQSLTLMFDLNTGAPLNIEEVNPSDLRWATQSVLSVLQGSPWRPRAMSVNSAGDLAIFADDEGVVRVTSLPLPTPPASPFAPQYPHMAHGSQMVGCCLTAGNQRALTIGTRDLAVLQWRIERVEETSDYAVRKGDDDNTLTASLDTVPAFKARAPRRPMPPHRGAVGAVLDHRGYTFLLDDPVGEFREAKPWRNAIHEPARKPPTNPEAPLTDLTLEWVHGMAPGVSGGLQVNAEGCPIYIAGRLGVLYEQNAGAAPRQRYFGGDHDEDVTALAVSASEAVLASAHGDQGMVHVWDARSLAPMAVVKFSLPGVAHLAFQGESLLAAIGEAADEGEGHGLVLVDWARNMVVASGVTTRERPEGLCCLGAERLVTCGPGFVHFWTVRAGALERRKGMFGRKGFIQNVTCVAALSDRRAVTGQQDGSLYVWEDERVVESAEECHPRAIECLRVSRGVIYTGGRDGSVKAFTFSLEEVMHVPFSSPVVHVAVAARADCVVACTADGALLRVPVSGGALGEPVVLVVGHAMGKEVWGLAANPKTHEYATAGDDAILRVWDAKACRMLRQRVMDAPMRTLAYSPDGSLLVVGYGDDGPASEWTGTFVVVSAEALEEVYRSKTGPGFVRDVKFSMDGALLAVASDGAALYLYDAQDNYLERGVCKGTGGSVAHLDFTDDGKYVQINSAKHELFYFSCNTLKRLKAGTAQMKDAVWSTWTCPLGWPVQGVWGSTPAGLEVMSLDRSHEGALMACGDERGSLRLYNSPCVEPDAFCNEYRAHARGVANCRWLYRDSHIISTGRDGGCIFQWRVVAPPDDVSDPTAEWALELAPLVRSPEVTLALTELTGAGQAGVSQDTLSLAEGSVAAAVDFPEPLPPPPILKGLPETDELVLEYVHGVRVHDCRHGVVGLATGEVVFLAVCVAVVHHPGDNTQRFYNGHSDEVLSVAVHPDGVTVATGQAGRLPEVHVWDSRTMVAQAVIVGCHQLGVSLLAFSRDGEVLASVGQDEYNTLAWHRWRAAGEARRQPQDPILLDALMAEAPVLGRWLVHREDLDERQVTPLTAKHGGLLGCRRTTRGRVLAMAISPGGNVCLVGNNYLRFWIDGVESPGHWGGRGECQTMSCVAFVSDAVAVTGATKGELYIWEGPALVSFIRAHREPVTCLAMHGPDLLSGGADGMLNMWRPQGAALEARGGLNLADWRAMGVTDGGPEAKDNVVRALASLCERAVLIATAATELLHWDPASNDIMVLVEGHCAGQVWGVATHPRQLEYATAGDDRTVRVWDGAGRRLLRRRVMPSTMRAITYSPDGRWLVVGTGGGAKAGAEEVGAFVVLDATTLEVSYKETQNPCRDVVRDVRFSPDGTLLAVASDDMFIHLYEAEKDFNKRGMCSGHTLRVTHLDFSDDGRYLQSAGGGGTELMFWNTKTVKQVRNRASELREVKWPTFSLPVGWPVQGVGRDAEGGPPRVITSVERSRDGRLMVCMDEHGKLRLYPYPCLDAKDTQGYCYRGHGLLGGRCRWTSKDSHVITVGGADRTVLQWRHIKTRIPPSMARRPDDEPNSDVEREYPERTLQQDSINEGYALSAEMDEQASEDSFVAVKPWVGLATPPAHLPIIPDPAAPPARALRLHWVYGYDGQRLRNRIRYTLGGHVVYTVGSVGVVYDPSTHSQRHFLRHTDDVISLTATDDGRFIATGQLGRVPRVYVWDGETAQALALLRGRLSRGVSELCFSRSGDLLACVGLDDEHTIAVYDWRNEALVCLGKAGRAKVLCLAFSPDGTTLAVGSVNEVNFHRLRPGVRYLHRRRGVWGKRYRFQPALCIRYLDSGMCVTGMLDGSLYFWEGMAAKALIQAHTGPVYSLECMGLSIVTGGADGAIKLWKEGFVAIELAQLSSAIKGLHVSAGRALVASTRDGHIYELNSSLGASPRLLVAGHSRGEIFGLATHPQCHDFATCGLDRTLRLWDGRTRRPLRHKVMDVSVSAVAFHPDGSMIAVGYGTPPRPGETEAEANGTVVVLNSLTLEVISKDCRAEGWIRAMRFSPDGTLLAAASNDRSTYIYEVTTGFKKVYNYKCTCKGHGKFVAHLDFSDDGRYLQTASGAYELYYWSTATGKQLVHGAVELKDTKWATWTSPMGWPVQGLWPEAPDGIEVTSADRSPSQAVLAATDDRGRIRLYAYPCLDPDAQHNLYGGHSPLITNCRWSHDEMFLLTTGGIEKSVFQWAVVVPQNQPLELRDTGSYNGGTGSGSSQKQTLME